MFIENYLSWCETPAFSLLIKKSSLSFSLSSSPLHCMMSPSNNTYILYFLLNNCIKPLQTQPDNFYFMRMDEENCPDLLSFG